MSCAFAVISQLAKEVRGIRRKPKGFDDLGVFAQMNAVRRRAQSLAKLNLELAEVEMKQKATALGIAGGLGAGAAAVVFYAIGFGFAAAAAGLAVVPKEVVQSRCRWLVAEAAVWSSVVVSLEVAGQGGGAFL